MVQKDISRRRVLNLIGSTTAITTSAGIGVATEKERPDNNPYGLDSKHNLSRDLTIINNSGERLEFLVEVIDRQSNMIEYSRSHKLHGFFEESGNSQNASKDIQINGLQGKKGVKTLEVATSEGHSTELNIYMDKFGIPSYMHVSASLMPDGTLQASFSVA